MPQRINATASTAFQRPKGWALYLRSKDYQAKIRIILI